MSFSCASPSFKRNLALGTESCEGNRPPPGLSESPAVPSGGGTGKNKAKRETHGLGAAPLGDQLGPCGLGKRRVPRRNKKPQTSSFYLLKGKEKGVLSQRYFTAQMGKPRHEARTGLHQRDPWVPALPHGQTLSWGQRDISCRPHTLSPALPVLSPNRGRLQGLGGGRRTPGTAGTRCSSCSWARLAVLPACREGDSRLPWGSARAGSGRRGARGELGEPAAFGAQTLLFHPNFGAETHAPAPASSALQEQRTGTLGSGMPNSSSSTLFALFFFLII